MLFKTGKYQKGYVLLTPNLAIGLIQTQNHSLTQEWSNGIFQRLSVRNSVFMRCTVMCCNLSRTKENLFCLRSLRFKLVKSLKPPSNTANIPVLAGSWKREADGTSPPGFSIKWTTGTWKYSWELDTKLICPRQRPVLCGVPLVTWGDNMTWRGSWERKNANNFT